jgi:hypothetical protein
MKKLLGIVVISLLWCNVGFAEVLEWKCTHPSIKYVNFKMDTVQKKLYANIENNHGAKLNEHYDILSMDNEKIVVETPLKNYPAWEFYYGTDQRAIDQGQTFYYNCNKTSGTTKMELASMIDKAKDTCKSLGFNEGTDKFSDCALKLYSQSVELAAEQNKTVVMQPQSSGSNVMTIYDPVRDSNALIKKGQRMLSGACTLGIDC